MSRLEVRCFVPVCSNTSKTEPKKKFVTFPKDNSLRSAWFNAIGKSPIRDECYCCEDHFNLYEDSVNYAKQKYFDEPIILKFNTVPHRNISVCRICSDKIEEKDKSVQLNTARKSIVFLINFHLPEIDLAMTDDPYMCCQCYRTLKTFEDLKSKALMFETGITAAYDSLTKDGFSKRGFQVNLNEYYKSIIQNTKIKDCGDRIDYDGMKREITSNGSEISNIPAKIPKLSIHKSRSSTENSETSQKTITNNKPQSSTSQKKRYPTTKIILSSNKSSPYLPKKGSKSSMIDSEKNTLYRSRSFDVGNVQKIDLSSITIKENILVKQAAKSQKNKKQNEGDNQNDNIVPKAKAEDDESNYGNENDAPMNEIDFIEENEEESDCLFCSDYKGEEIMEHIFTHKNSRIVCNLCGFSNNHATEDIINEHILDHSITANEMEG